MPGERELIPYAEEEIRERLKGIPEWRYEDGYLVREYQTKNWRETVFLFNAIASLSEAHWHHPDIEASFKRLKVKLKSHEANGITDKDFELAREVEKISSLLLKR